jgi:hypothetical protein
MSTSLLPLLAGVAAPLILLVVVMATKGVLARLRHSHFAPMAATPPQRPRALGKPLVLIASIADALLLLAAAVAVFANIRD